MTPPQNRSITIPLGAGELPGDLASPPTPRALVLFAHGSGSSRHSPRNQFVATQLNQAGLATLLFDLLTQSEEIAERSTRHLRFNIPLLAERLIAATDEIARDPALSSLPIGYFGASTGGAAALVAAAQRPHLVHAVVSRGGRPDLAATALPQVQAATLLIVGGEDHDVIQLNSQAYAQLHCEKHLEIVPGASHLFEEPGTLESVATLAAEWFTHHLVLAPAPQNPRATGPAEENKT